jgi:hypothetical protein
MRLFTLLLFLMILVACQSETTGPMDCGYSDQDDLISSRVETISQARLMETVTALTSIHTRYMHNDEGCTETLNLLVEWLEEQGNVAQWDSFSFFRLRQIDTANVYVDFPGTVAPERKILVGAHWDSSAGNGNWWYDEFNIPHHDSSTIAPGAVDNATGVAALLELTRILRDTPTAYSVRVMFFAGEELGFKGSKPIADWWKYEEGPDSLVCMINVDMIGWDGDETRDISLLCHGSTVPMAVDALALAAELAEPVFLDTLNWENENNAPASDQYWFWLNRLPALYFSEGPFDNFPHANSSQDTLGAVMPDMLEAGSRALAATVLQIAIPQLPAL